jgi:Adenylate and Guanylate cyclase catalytic domain
MWTIEHCMLCPNTRVSLVSHVPCHAMYTQAAYLGVGDLHDPDYHKTVSTIPLFLLDNTTASMPGHCLYYLSLYYSDAFATRSNQHLPITATAIIAVIFGLLASSFWVYDRFVHQRNVKIMSAAASSNAFLSTLFPTDVRQRLLADEEAEDDDDDGDNVRASRSGPLTLSSSLRDSEMDQDTKPGYKTKPIADLFTETTVLFADISGFSAWSSVREPAQVLMLLETLFRAFDEIAKKRGIFKVSNRRSKTCGWNCLSFATGVLNVWSGQLWSAGGNGW